MYSIDRFLFCFVLFFMPQVADVLQFSMETGGFLPNCISSLQESLIRHLKVAPKYLSFLEERQKLIQVSTEACSINFSKGFVSGIISILYRHMLVCKHMSIAKILAGSNGKLVCDFKWIKARIQS